MSEKNTARDLIGALRARGWRMARSGDPCGGAIEDPGRGGGRLHPVRRGQGRPLARARVSLRHRSRCTGRPA